MQLTPRQASLARNKFLREGVRRNFYRYWAEREDLVCCLFYPNLGTIKWLLPWRTTGAIRWRCKQLNLFKPLCHRWTAREISILRKLYPSGTREEICEAIPNVDWQRICVAARYYGFRRDKKPYKITGVKALDGVRSKCYDLRWTMRDLDEECRTRNYFQTRGYRSEYPNFKAINRAVSTLGGILEVHWEE